MCLWSIRVSRSSSWERMVLSINGAGRIGYLSTCKRMKLDYYLTSHTKFNSKWIKELSIGAITKKTL